MSSLYSVLDIPVEEEGPEWRSRSLQERLIYVFENQLIFDLKIVVKSQTFKVHKCILSPFSSVFKKEFYNQKQAPSIYFRDDIEPDVFNILLRVLCHSAFLSYGEADTEEFYSSLPDFRLASSVIDACDAAEKLGMPRIKALIEQLCQMFYLHRHSISSKEFWILLKFSQPLKPPTLKMLREYANSHAEEILNCKEFSAATKKIMKLVIHLLSIPESMIFELIAEWFERNKHHPSTKRSVDDLMACVNFQKLSKNEFSDVILNHEDLINIEGINDILMYFFDPTVNPLPIRYSTEERNYSLDPELTVEYVKQASSCLRYYHEGEFSDFLLYAYHSKKYIRAHKLILYLGSAVFEDLLSSSSQTSICLYTEPENLKLILKCFYGYPVESIFKSWMSALQAFDTALRYGCRTIQMNAKQYLKSITLTEDIILTLIGQEGIIKHCSVNKKVLLREYRELSSANILRH